MLKYKRVDRTETRRRSVVKVILGIVAVLFIANGTFHIINGIRHDYMEEPLYKTHIAVKFAIAIVLGILSYHL